jgi:RimJ/RimL family protein N-acetyltransferase
MNATIQPFPNGPGSTILTTRRGRPVRVRHLTAADDELLVDLYHRLSPRSRWLRFFQHTQQASDEVIWREAIRLARLPPLEHAALIAIVPEAGIDTAVGVARLARDLEKPDIAEVAVVIRDDYQGEGLGTQLLDLLVQVALASDLRQLHAISLEENTAIQRIVRASGFPVTTDTRNGETVQVITLQ